MPSTSVLLGLTLVSAGLPSIATVPVQRSEARGEKQRRILILAGGIVMLGIIGALIGVDALLYLALVLMFALYCFMVFAPLDWINQFEVFLEGVLP